MEPELHGVGLVAPPLPSQPLPPPVAPPLASQFGAATLRRWNERLALIVGGLTILLLGVVVGRVLGPATSQTTLASAAPNLELTEPVESAAEVNPPENVAAEVTPSAVAPEPAIEKSVAPVVSVPPPPPVESATTFAIAAEQEASIPAAGDVPEKPVAAATSTEPQFTKHQVATIIAPPSTQVCEPAKDFKDRKLNTALTWAESLDEASRQAEEKEKLVFLIHISGNFESPGFT